MTVITYNFAIKNILYCVAFVVEEIFITISNEGIPNIFPLVIDKMSDEFLKKLFLYSKVTTI